MIVMILLAGVAPALMAQGSAQDNGSAAGAAGSDEQAVAGDEKEAHMSSADEPETNLDWAQVRYVAARETEDGVWTFEVTVEHNDQGWDHYANLWQVVHPETNEVYGERELAHPHDNEQPFTRSQRGIRIPDGQTSVLVRARCDEHGWGGQEILVDLTGSSGENYEVRR